MMTFLLEWVEKTQGFIKLDLLGASVTPKEHGGFGITDLRTFGIIVQIVVENCLKSGWDLTIYANVQVRNVEGFAEVKAVQYDSRLII